MKSKLQVPQCLHDRSIIEFLLKQPMVETALRMLVRAHNLAHENNFNAWQLAVSIADLRAFGVPSTELMIPLEKGYIEHAHEQTRPGAAKRSFRGHAGSLLTDRSCFVLTKAGAALAHRLLESSGSRTQPVIPVGQTAKTMARRDSPHLTPPPPNSPHWDEFRRVLSFCGQIVLQLTRPAPNQELLLLGFEAAHWAQRIQDPLPKEPGIASKQRLHDTIKSLNRALRDSSLQFHGDGTGRGVCWGLVE